MDNHGEFGPYTTRRVTHTASNSFTMSVVSLAEGEASPALPLLGDRRRRRAILGRGAAWLAVGDSCHRKSQKCKSA